MKYAHIFTIALCLWFASGFSFAAQKLQTADPVPIIFDTDIGNDVDDVLALGVAHALQKRGECKILAVTITKDNPHAPMLVDRINTFYGYPNIPIGIVKDGVTPEDGSYLRETILTADENSQHVFPGKLEPNSRVPEAVSLLRQTLAGEKDNSVVVIQVGFSTNLARLLETGADSISTLSGPELVAKKVKLLSIMAGTFDPKYTHVEYNIRHDVPSAKSLMADWPTPMVFSGFEIGDAIHYPGVSMKEDYQYVKFHPLKEAYIHHTGLEGNRPTFDLTSVLYAVRPNRGYFDISEPGTVVLDAQGHTSFQANPAGKHRVMKVSATQIAQVREALCLLCSEPPRTVRIRR